MFWCENCGKEYDGPPRETCPHCGVPLQAIAPEELEQGKAEWSLAPDTLSWPMGEDGAPEQAVFLTESPDAGAGGDITISMLRAFGVPVVRGYPGDGQLGKVLLGFSGYGSDLYVPKSMLELAKELIMPPELADEEGEQE